MARDQRVQTRVSGRDPREVAQALATVGAMMDAAAKPIITVGDEAANVRRFRVLVADNRGQAWEGRWLVLIHITPTADGDPDPTGNTVTFPTGFVLATIVAGAVYEVLSDEDGVVEMDLEVTGAATRHVYAAVLDRPEGSGAVAWT